ncbi:MAG: copper chaperone PCu(A)C [Sphingomonas sp.]
MTFARHILALTAAIIAAPLGAHDFTVGALKIGHPWSRETAPGQSAGGGFLTITNNGKQADRLISAASPAAEQVQIHTVSMTGGVMRMRELPGGLEIPAGATVTLKPGGYHIMLVGLKAPLKQGTMVPAELRFQRAGKISIQFKVEAIGYGGPAGAHHAGH